VSYSSIDDFTKGLVHIRTLKWESENLKIGYIDPIKTHMIQENESKM